VNSTPTFEGLDLDLINPPVTGLDATFDRVIRSSPETLTRASDDIFLDPDLSRNPVVLLERLRDRLGYVVPGSGTGFGDLVIPDLFGDTRLGPHFAIFGVDEMDQVHMDPASAVNKGAYGTLGESTGMALGQKQGTIPTVEDGAVHDELRALYDTVLNHNTMAQRSDKIIEPICNWLIDRIEWKLKHGESVCLCLDLAVPLTYKALSTMLGVPHEFLSDFVRLGDLFFSSGFQPEAGSAAANELYGFFLDEVEKRRVEPRRDLLTYFLKATLNGVPALSPEAVAITGRFVLIAGIDTTWRQLALVMAALLSHPDQFEELCLEPAKLSRKVVEEGLRYAPSGFVVPRRTTKSLVLGGVSIPAGSHITTYQGIANRDPRRWDDPDTFDIHRQFKTNRTFGVGVHSCAGQHLARLEILTCVQLIAQRLPNLRLTIEPDQLEVRGLQIRVPRTVPVGLG